ncbi:MAG: SPASM domain-containing protein [Alphaproteobacteria bacterium]|nr:SPASM domain-containing protein [Alphaproteobacteria bacterium]
MTGPADMHRFDTEFGPHVLVADGSRIYAINPEFDRALQSAAADPQALQALLDDAGLGSLGFIGGGRIVDPPLRSVSLSVAQKCNLGCTYCYAHKGDFGSVPRDMPAHVAEAALQLLFKTAATGERVNVAFLGGEPLTNRKLIRTATARALELAAKRGVQVGFAITTNATLLTPDDVEFFAAHRFTVTVSLDGDEALHDTQRPFKGGSGSYARIIARLAPLLALQDRVQVFARVSVTPRNLELARILEHLANVGFRSVGFSPVLASPSGADTLHGEDMENLLTQMTACGRDFVDQVIRGVRPVFANLASALIEIHRGTHRPYPCGAGAGYAAVGADSGLYACHRFVGDDAGVLGDVRNGIDRGKQRQWLEERAVDRQTPCTTCWARYLCGGGCHHEVIHAGRPACDFIRGWLHFCLQAYVTISERAPGYIEPLSRA